MNARVKKQSKGLGPRAAALILSLSALILLRACGGDCEGESCEGSVDSVSNYKGLSGCSFVPADRFVDAAVEAWCTPRPTCHRRSRPGDRFGWAGACRDWVRTQLLAPHGIELLLAKVSEGEVSYHPKEACTCLNHVLQSCVEIDLMLTDVACHRIFSGSRLNGRSCRWPQECAGGFCRLNGTNASSNCPGKCAPTMDLGDACSLSEGCAVGQRCVAGQCVALGRGELGQPCQASGCVKGSWCDWGAGIKCVPRLPKGESCTPSDRNCLEGLYCAPDPDPTKTGHRCALLYAPGEICALDGGPDVQTCALGSVCVEDHCLGWAGLGETCTHDAQCPSDALCVGANPKTKTTGQCKPLPGKNDLCNPFKLSSAGYDCLPPWLCDAKAGHCRSLPDAGETCVQDKCAAGLDCVDGSCSTGPKDGQPCASSGKICADGLVCVEETCQPEVCL